MLAQPCPGEKALLSLRGPGKSGTMGVPVKICYYGLAPALLQEGQIVCSQV
jgi:hypothetical protein